MLETKSPKKNHNIHNSIKKICIRFNTNLEKKEINQQVKPKEQLASIHVIIGDFRRMRWAHIALKRVQNHARIHEWIS